MFKENDFRWMCYWGFNWVRLPMDYRSGPTPGDPMKIEEKKIAPIDSRHLPRRKIWNAYQYLPAPGAGRPAASTLAARPIPIR